MFLNRGERMQDMEIMDNFALDVRARSRKSFNHAVAIALAATPGGKVSHWCEHREYGLVLFWSGTDEQFHGSPIHPLPCELGPAEAADFAWLWLSKADREKFKLKDMDAEYDDGNVECEQAYRVFVQDWGHVGGSFYGAAAILPVWAWLGK